MIELIVEDGKYDLFKDVLEPIENLSHKFDQIWAVLKTLYLADMSIMPARLYYPIHNKACMSHTTKYNSKPIYEACKVCVFIIYFILKFNFACISSILNSIICRKLICQN